MMNNLVLEISSPNSDRLNNNSLFKELLFEFCGMYLFITLSLGNVAIFSLYPNSNFTWAGISISWGLNLLFSIYLSKLYSLAHLNPVITFSTFLLTNLISFKKMILYTLIQLCAAFLAASTIYGIYYNKFGNDDQYANILTTSPNDDISFYCAWFNEFFGTFLLIGGIFTFSNSIKNNNYLPVFISIWFTTLIFALGFQTSFAWNPARDLGPRIFSSMVGYSSFNDFYFWIPLTANYIGGILGAYVAVYLIK